MFAILVECSQFCSRSLSYECKRKSITSLGLGREEGHQNLTTLMITEEHYRAKVLSMCIQISKNKSNIMSPLTLIIITIMNSIHWADVGLPTLHRHSIFQLHWRSSSMQIRCIPTKQGLKRTQTTRSTPTTITAKNGEMPPTSTFPDSWILERCCQGTGRATLLAKLPCQEGRTLLQKASESLENKDASSSTFAKMEEHSSS